MIRRRRQDFYPSGHDPRIRELEERYHEVDCRVRNDNPRDVVLLKVQRDRWLRSLEKVRGKVAGRKYPAVEQLDRLIRDWYKQSQVG